MGTKKQVERTGHIELLVPQEFARHCTEVRIGLNKLEDQLVKYFPEVNGATADSHMQVQEALHHYYTALANARAVDRIKKFGVIAIEDDPFAHLIPNFVRYLSRFGEISSSSEIDVKQGLFRFGIFLKRENHEPRLLGLVGARRNPRQLEYAGYVPTELSEREFHGCPIYHLSTLDLGKGNFAFVNLFSEERNGRMERADGFGTKGIDFP